MGPAPQVGQLDPIRFGSPVIQPTMSGAPLILSQHEWPNLPIPLRKIVPPVQTNTTADAPNVKGDISDAALEKPDGQDIHEDDHMSEGEVNAEVLEAKEDVSDVFV